MFSRRGLERASVDEIAEDAGFTKGAFYANFASKEEIFLAMLDERFAERLAEVERVTEDDRSRRSRHGAAGRASRHYLRADPEWQRLFFEFAAYAARDERFRAELVKRYRLLQERVAEVYRRRARAARDRTADPGRTRVRDDIRDGQRSSRFEMLLDPEALPDDAFGTMLGAFFAGLQKMAEG